MISLRIYFISTCSYLKLSGVYFSLFVVINALCTHNVRAEMLWQWSYIGEDILATGTFTTSKATDSNGFYQILSITGYRNGELISGLYPNSKAIPGNEPYALDNLIRVNKQGQITLHGFGFVTISGSYANAFFTDILAKPSYMEVFTTPPNYYKERPITFSAMPFLEP